MGQLDAHELGRAVVRGHATWNVQDASGEVSTLRLEKDGPGSPVFVLRWASGSHCWDVARGSRVTDLLAQMHEYFPQGLRLSEH